MRPSTAFCSNKRNPAFKGFKGAVDFCFYYLDLTVILYDIKSEHCWHSFTEEGVENRGA